MKRIVSFTIFLLAISMLYFSCNKTGRTGSIYGIVTDQATGEPIKSAGVELMPIGLKTVTGSDGTYTFTDIETGEYELFVTKMGYEDTKKSGIKVKGGVTQYDVQMAKHTGLRIVDDNGNDIEELNFGSETDVVSRLFNIFNDSGSTFEWSIHTTANWISSVSTSSGTLPAGGTQGIIVVINRDFLQQGWNTTTLHVTSNNGNKQLTIKAKKEDISTLDATAVSSYSAILNGRINTNMDYTEKGFCYGEHHNLNNSVVVEGNGTGPFSSQITGLHTGIRYYFKAYCIHNDTYLYGDEKEFQYIPSFEYEGQVYWVAPDPGYDINYNDAVAYCSGLSLYGC